LLRGNTGRAPTGSLVGKEFWAQADWGAFRVELFAMAYDAYLTFDGDLDYDAKTDDIDFVIFASAYDELVCP